MLPADHFINLSIRCVVSLYVGEDRCDFCDSCIRRLQLQVPETPRHHTTRGKPSTNPGVCKSDKVFQSSRRLETLRWEAVRHRMQSQIKVCVVQ